MSFDAERYAGIAERHAWDDRAAAKADVDDVRNRIRWHKDLTNAVGRRYAGCTLENYCASTGPQTLALESLRAYAKAIREHVVSGYGVTLFGSCGTGKDHLAIALCREAIEAGVRSVWVDAEAQFAELRASFRDDARKDEREVFRSLETVPVLALSDPIPQSGELTEYQSRAIRRVIGARYANLLPTILTLNVATGDEAKQRLGVAVYDRIRGSSLAIHCNWPSHRQPATRTPSTPEPQ